MNTLKLWLDRVLDNLSKAPFPKKDGTVARFCDHCNLTNTQLKYLLWDLITVAKLLNAL